MYTIITLDQNNSIEFKLYTPPWRSTERSNERWAHFHNYSVRRATRAQEIDRRQHHQRLNHQTRENRENENSQTRHFQSSRFIGGPQYLTGYQKYHGHRSCPAQKSLHYLNRSKYSLLCNALYRMFLIERTLWPSRWFRQLQRLSFRKSPATAFSSPPTWFPVPSRILIRKIPIRGRLCRMCIDAISASRTLW